MLPERNVTKFKVVFFSPFANVWDHALPESILAGGLSKNNWDVEFLRCDGLFSNYCVAMSAAGLKYDASPRQKSNICGSCRRRRNLLTSLNTGKDKYIEDHLTDEDFQIAETHVANITHENWPDFQLDGFFFGKYAAHEIWLENKLISAALPQELWDTYVGQFRNTLLSYFGSIRFLKDSKATHVITYNDHYSVNHAFVAAAFNLGLQSYTIHGGLHALQRHQTLSMTKYGVSLSDVIDSRAWSKFSRVPINREQFELVRNHIVGLWSGSSPFAYSKKKDGLSPSLIKSKFKIPDKSTVLLATTSSEDEHLALDLIGLSPKNLHKKPLFSSQIEWLYFLEKYAAANPTHYIIVRLHPRLFPNKRDPKLAPSVAKFDEIISRAPENLIFNLPRDEISIYDFVPIVDAVLNYSSSVGAEFLAQGIPVVAPVHTKLTLFPQEIQLLASSEKEYLEQIEKALNEGRGVEYSRLAFRWFAFLFTQFAVKLSPLSHPQNFSIRPQHPGLFLALWRWAAHIYVTFFPLIRERRQIRTSDLDPRALSIFESTLRDTLESLSDVYMNNLVDKDSASLEEETMLLRDFLRGIESKD